MLRLTKSQYAQLARSAEHILKKAKDHMQGSGPDDYGAPDMLETYLYRHPMGMLEFWVDDGGIAGGGFKSSFRKLMKSVGKRIGMVSKHAKSRAKAHLEDMQNQGKAKLHDKLEEGRAQAEKVARELGDSVIDKAQSAVSDVTQRALGGSGHGCGGGDCGCAKKSCMHGGHFYNMKGKASQKGKHRHEHDPNPKKVRKMPPGLAGGAFAPGSDAGVTGVGLNLQQLGFVSAMVPGAPAGSMAVPFNNHLQTFNAAPPAGGYGSYGMPISGGAC